VSKETVAVQDQDGSGHSHGRGRQRRVGDRKVLLVYGARITEVALGDSTEQRLVYPSSRYLFLENQDRA
jgi:hypothetical protein